MRRLVLLVSIVGVAAAVLLATVIGGRGAADTGVAVIEIDVTAPDGSPPSRGLVAFLPDEESGEEHYWEDVLDERGRGVLRPRVGVSGTLFVIAQDLTAWESQPLVVAPGRLRIVVPLSDGLSVDGVVVGRDGLTPVARAKICVTERALQGVRAGLGMRTVTTDADGRFRAAGLVAGSVRLDARGSDALPDLGTHGADVVDAGTRGVRLMLWRTIRVRFLPVDAVTGGGLATSCVELEELLEDGRWATRHFDPWRSVEPSPEPCLVPRAPLWVSGHAIARYRIRATSYRQSRVVEIDPNLGPAEQTIRVEMTPDPDSVSTLKLYVETEDGDVPEWVHVTLRSSDRRRERRRRFRASGAPVELELPPGAPSLRVEGWFRSRGRRPDVPWLPVDVVCYVGGERRIVLPAGGFLRMLGEPEHVYLPPEAHRVGAPDEDPVIVLWNRDRDSPTYTSLPMPGGEYEMRWWIGKGRDDGTWRTQRFTVHPREVTELRRPAE